MGLRKLKFYFKEAKRFEREYSENFSILELIQFFPVWQRSLNSQASPLTDEQPWLTFAAIQFLEKTLRKDMRVYEYGAGGSTLFFAKRVKEVISVEHDQIWSDKIFEVIKKRNYHNSLIHLVEPTTNEFLLGQDPSEPNSYISSLDLFTNQYFKDYAINIDNYPDGYFDVVLIDGRARPSCFKHAITKVKEGGFLILDNAERPHYLYIHEFLENSHWIKYELHGPGPYNLYFWQTCVWQKI